MPATFTNLLYHIVYSTKYRRTLIQPQWQDDLYGYIGGIIREQQGILLQAGGMPDHIHLLTKLSPRFAIADTLRLVKANSSKWINEQHRPDRAFHWQPGYAAFSVSESQGGILRRYIQNQQQHHRRRSFEDELRQLLEKHNIYYDPCYVFEEEHIA